jgi:serine/threonine-protein kinase
MNCVKCGNALDQGVKFCGNCGTQQPGAATAKPAAAVNPAAKTMFQGGGPAPAPAPKPVVKKDDVGFAATIAPGTGQLPVQVPAVVRATGNAAVVKTPQPTPAPMPAAVDPSWEGDLTGKTLNNRYLIEGKLGEGGFGSVYRAKQTQMNRSVALKVLHAKMAKDPQVVGRFKREAQASSLLRAAHTVQVYDFDQTPEGVMYLSMEMLTGKSLHAVLGEGAISPQRVIRILDGIAESLEEAHRQGIVHRDIKPENIYLEPRPTADFVKVLDFGIAKIVSGDGLGSQPALTAAGQTLGTLEYMSPEQLMGKQLDGRSDLYALGTLAYEMLTGNLPFSSKTPGEIISYHLKTVPPPPSSKMPQANIPQALDELVIALIQKNRDDRFKDTTELRTALAALMAGQEPPARISAQQPVVAAPPPANRPPSAQQPMPPPAAAPPPTVKAPPQGGGMSPQIMMIAAGLVIGIVAVLVALFLKR